jgi:hypothetical protein
MQGMSLKVIIKVEKIGFYNTLNYHLTTFFEANYITTFTTSEL